MATDQPINVAAHLPRMARAQPDAPAVILQHGLDRYTQLSFKDLDVESNLLAAGLAQHDIGFGTRTVLMVKPSLEFFALTFALLKAGAVPVLIDPGLGLVHLKRCIADAEPQAFIGISKAQAARVILGWGSKSIRTRVTVGSRWFWGGTGYATVKKAGLAAPQFKLPEVKPDDPAAILFTSGSTGPPKGAVYTHSIFAAQVEALRQLYDITPGERDLATFPLFALFGPALGMTAIVPDMDASRPARAKPERLVAAIQKWNATNMFGSPALLDRLSRYGEMYALKLPSLKRVLSAGAPVEPVILERMQKLLAPGVEVFTPYGATEALPVASIGSAEVLNDTRHATARGAGICVGRVHGVDLRIIRIFDEPIAHWSDDLILPAGEVGEITVRGPVVTQSYFKRPEQTAASKIADGSGRFWHRMGDVGSLDSQGRLWMCGRKSHRVQTRAGLLFSVPCEAIFNQHAQVFRTALVGVGQALAQTPVLCVELVEGSRTKREQLTRELLELGAQHAHTRAIRNVLFHSGFPVDIRHNAKISREKLSLWAAKRVRSEN